MIVFKPRLALFYFVALVIISLVTKRLTITSQAAMADASVEKVQHEGKVVVEKAPYESCADAEKNQQAQPGRTNVESCQVR